MDYVTNRLTEILRPPQTLREHVCFCRFIKLSFITFVPIDRQSSNVHLTPVIIRTQSKWLIELQQLLTKLTQPQLLISPLCSSAVILTSALESFSALLHDFYSLLPLFRPLFPAFTTKYIQYWILTIP